MTKLILSLTAGLVLALTGAMIGGRAEAAMIAPDGLRTAADQVGVRDEVQFRFRGRRFCWYANGWRGPGWYWCGYRLRRGLGWGGPAGWHGWRHAGHRPSARPPHRPGIRPPIGHLPGHRPGARPPHRPGIRPPIGQLPGGGHRPGAHPPGGHRPGGGNAGANRPRGSGRGGDRGGGNS